jgi:hypothetical protein
MKQILKHHRDHLSGGERVRRAPCLSFNLLRQNPVLFHVRFWCALMLFLSRSWIHFSLDIEYQLVLITLFFEYFRNKCETDKIFNIQKYIYLNYLLIFVGGRNKRSTDSHYRYPVRSFRQGKRNDTACDDSHAMGPAYCIIIFFHGAKRSRKPSGLSRGVPSPYTPASPMSVGNCVQASCTRIRVEGHLPFPYTLNNLRSYVCSAVTVGPGQISFPARIRR